MDKLHEHRPADDAPTTPDEADLLAAMEQADRDVAAGHTVPLAGIFRELDSTADRIEARRRARRA
jgi:hypothetical protein